MNISFFTKPSVVSVAVLLILTAATYIVFFSDENETVQLPGISNHIPNTSTIEIDSTQKPEKTIETTWQWERPPISPLETFPDSHDIIEAKSVSIFSEESVYNALRHVRVDSQNNVIIDHETLVALNETLNDSRLQLDDQALSELQTIIRLGLPGDVGDEVARIAGNYYHLLEASREFDAVYEADPSATLDIEKTTEEHEENYRELMALRELYLGTNVANKLFSTSNANANYMFDMFNLAQDTHLSEEEKQQLRAEITERNTEQTIDVRNWNERHKAFLVAKQNILMASINDEEKQTQLTELTHQHFNGEELAHVRHMQLDKP